MHGIHIPFTGMIVSCLAVTCIIFIAYYVPSKNNIIKATIIVACFKLMLSPHSPPTAYIAVFFQGTLGQLLFYKKRFFMASAIILAVMALVESAVQRILVLMILYGNTFWYALNEFIHKTVGTNNINYSSLIAILYILLHAIVGVFTGIYAVNLANRSDSWRKDHTSLQFKIIPGAIPGNNDQRNKRIKWFFVLLWMILILLFLYSYLYPGQSVIRPGEVLKIILRSVLILLTWHIIIAPVMMHFIKRSLHAQQTKQKTALKEIMAIIPATKYIFIQSWKVSAEEKGIKRIKYFLKVLFVNILSTKLPE